MNIYSFSWIFIHFILYKCIIKMSKNESEIIENIFLIIPDFRLFSSYLYIHERVSTRVCMHVHTLVALYLLHFHLLFTSILFTFTSHLSPVSPPFNPYFCVVNNSLTLYLQIDLIKTIYIWKQIWYNRIRK